MIAASADTFFCYFLDVWAGEPRAIPALAIHGTSDPGTIIVEQEPLGSSASNGEFALPNIVVLTVRHGRSPVCATTSTSRQPQPPWDAACKRGYPGQLTEIGLTRPATKIVGIHTPPRGYGCPR